MYGRSVSLEVSFCLQNSPPPPSLKPDSTLGVYSVRLRVLLSVRHSISLSHEFSLLVLAMLSDIWLKVGSELPYGFLKIKCDYHHGWPTFSTTFCVAFEVNRHIGITLSGVCLSVCLSGSHTFLVVTHSSMFRRRHMHSSECCHYV